MTEKLVVVRGKLVVVSKATHMALVNLKHGNDTMNDVILRLLSENEELRERVANLEAKLRKLETKEAGKMSASDLAAFTTRLRRELDECFKPLIEELQRFNHNIEAFLKLEDEKP